jgi:hypothetical protein
MLHIVYVFFIGQLNLMQLPLVEIRSRKMMQAVTSLCPNLRIVEFDCYRFGITAPSDIMSIQELQSMLTREQSNANSCWSKVYFNCFNLILRHCLIVLLAVNAL